MKSFLTLVVLALSSVSFATPAVKDQVTFKGVFAGGGGGTIDFQQTLEITGFANEQWLVRSTLLVNGQNRVEDIQVGKADLMDDAQLKMIIENCAQMGGTSESLTVPAGSFLTCAVDQERGGKVWLGEVPFGIVKQVSVDEEENTITTELSSFVRGN
jgi:hypothetical protein